MLRTAPLFALLIFLASVAQAQEAGHVPGDIIAMLAPDVAPASVANDLAVVNGVPTRLEVMNVVSAPMRAWLFHYDHDVLSEQDMLNAFYRNPKVQMAQLNHIVRERVVPSDTEYGQQWQHQNIMSEAAWDITTGGVTATGDTIVVCVLENCDLPHPDLIDNAWFNHLEIPNNGVDDDANGYVDDHRGWNTPNNNDNVYGGSHGTQVAGMIGATGNNALGVVGANWNVKIMVVQYGGVQEAAVIAAYTYPWQMRKLYRTTNGSKGAFVVSTNASWGIDGGQPADAPLWCAIYDSLGTEGILSCGATANQNYDVDQVGDLPTACPSDFMVSVTATNSSDVRTFSGYGATTIDVGAPGSSVYTTSLGGGYGSTSGTSFASPLTAGVIGLLYSAPCSSLMDLVLNDPQAGALYVRQALFDGVDQVGNLPGNTVTGGRINAFNSLQSIMDNCGACPTPYSVNAEAVDATTATVSWNSTSAGPFNLQYHPVGDTTWTVMNGLVNTSFQASNLQPCTAYEFQVEAVCDSLSSGYSSTFTLMPPTEAVPTITLSGEEMFCDGGSVTLTSSAADNVWSTQETTASIVVEQTGTYSVMALGVCDSAASTTVDITVLPVVLPTSSNVNLPGPGTATLVATGDSIVWWDADLGGNVVGTGNSWETPFLSTPTDYWCSNIEIYGGGTSYGADTDRSTTGQYHPNGNNYLLFTANDAFVIRSVKVYADGAGARPIALVDVDNNITVDQASFIVPDGESRVQLDFTVPGPGNYGLRITSGDPQLWRDGLGSNPPYPFPLGTLGSVIGTTVTGANSTSYYYFFYDWEVEAISILCESDRIPVSVSMPVGISEQDGTGASVYPDPADQQIFFAIDHAGTDMVVTVLDQTGRIVAEESLRNGRAMVTTARMAEGMYVYRITDRDRLLHRGRFIVAHF